MVRNTDNSNEMLHVQKLREILTIVTLIISIGGVLYSIILKPTSDISNLKGELRLINYRLDAIEKRL